MSVSVYQSKYRNGSIGVITLLALQATVFAQPSADERREQARMFHLRAQQRAGLLVPLYIYPANVHTNPAYNRLMELRRQYETVPMWVIVNPASGPGKQVDANYTRAIDRLIGSGCMVLGYVSTSYGKRPVDDVTGDIDRWLKLYPRTQGIFFDEMAYENTEAGVRHQSKLNRHARARGCWPTVANPGASTPGRYFAGECADVIVVHEGSEWPSEKTLHGDYFGSYADYPPFTRAVLLHSTGKLHAKSLRMARQYARWFYVTQAPYRAGDPMAANPWSVLSDHLEFMCQQLSKSAGN